MVFSSNPLSLSVTEPAFEKWLRDSGYLEVLDQRTSELHRVSTTTTTSATTPATSSTTTTASTASLANGFFISFFSHLTTLLSLLTINPFAKLTTDDFTGQTASWTKSFVGSCHLYSFPSSSQQAKLRVHENVKRYARNYAYLFVVIFACSLYQMPLAIVGVISCLALWDALKYCNDRWRWDRYPAIRQSLIRICQCATAVILFWSNVQMALFYTLCVSYAVLVIHAAFRKLAPVKEPSRGRRK